MAKLIEVNGEALVRTGTAAANALEDLAVSIDGVRIVLNEHTEKVMTDTFGPAVPFDEQHFLVDADIFVTAIFFDETVLAKIRFRVSGTDGLEGAAGTLWGAGGKYFKLFIASPTASLPHNFPTARLEAAIEKKVGTKRTQWELHFYAIPYTGVSGTSTGATLYTRALT